MAACAAERISERGFDYMYEMNGVVAGSIGSPNLPPRPSGVQSGVPPRQETRPSIAGSLYFAAQPPRGKLLPDIVGLAAVAYLGAALRMGKSHTGPAPVVWFGDRLRKKRSGRFEIVEAKPKP